MTVVHTYFYIVFDTQRGCHTLKLANEYGQNNVNEIEHVQFDITLTKNIQQSTREGETLRGNCQKL